MNFIPILKIGKEGVKMNFALFLIGILIGYVFHSIIAVGKKEDMKIAIQQMAYLSDNTLCRKLVDEQ